MRSRGTGAQFLRKTLATPADVDGDSATRSRTTCSMSAGWSGGHWCGRDRSPLREGISPDGPDYLCSMARRMSSSVRPWARAARDQVECRTACDGRVVLTSVTPGTVRSCGDHPVLDLPLVGHGVGVPSGFRAAGAFDLHRKMSPSGAIGPIVGSAMPSGSDSRASCSRSFTSWRAK